MNSYERMNNENNKLPQSFYNSVYNNTNQSATPSANVNNSSRVHFDIDRFERKELDNVSHRLDIYVNTVRQLAEHRIYGYHNDKTFNLINSLKYLENDIDVFKDLYENEIKIHRLQIDELNSEKTKYRLDAYNLDTKLRELTHKFDEQKSTNEKLTKENNDLKSLNERLEFDTKNLRMEFERPVLDFNNLKKEFDGLTNSYNELQTKYNNESTARQQLEMQLNELSQEHAFYKNMSSERIEALENEVKNASNAAKDLQTKLKDNEQVDSNITNLLNEVQDKAEHQLQRYKAEADELHRKNLAVVNEQLKETRLNTEKLKLDIHKLDQRNDTLQTICRNLEATVQNLEQTKRSLESELIEQKTKALKNLSEIEDKLNDFQQLFLQSLEESKQPPVSINLEIESLKELINDEELRLKSNSPLNSNSNFLSKSNQYENSTSENLDENIHSEEKKSESKSNLFHKIPPTQSPIGPISLSGRRIHSAKSSNHSLPLQENNNINNYSLNENNNNNTSVDLVERQQQPYLQSQPVSQASNRLRASSATLYSKRASPSYTPPQQSSIQPLNLTQSKDYTSEMFNNFQKSVLKNKKPSNLLYNSVDNTITEASYTGNIKIHEVNKNGYYIRLLNVSNNCDEDISGFTIQQMVSSMPVAVYNLPSNLQLPAGQTITVWSRTDEVEQNPPHTFVCKEQDKWGTGPECTTVLAKPNGQAVSWVTGCHKFGNMDFDEIASVYSRSQKRTRSAAQLNREKITPHIIYKYNATKHPHTTNPSSSTHPASTANDTNVHRQRSITSASSARKPTINAIIENDLNASFKSPSLNSSITNAKDQQQQQYDEGEDGEISYTYQQNIAYYRITRN